MKKNFNQYIFATLSIGLILLIVGLYQAFSVSDDAVHNNTIKIMFVHVPTAWLAIISCLTTGITSGSYLFKPNETTITTAIESAKFGCAFSLSCIISGSLWGLPAWGVLWTWDPRLISMLIMFFTFASSLALYKTFDEKTKANNAFAIVSLFGLLNVFLVKFSIKWFRSIHQEDSISVLKMTSNIAAEFMLPLIIMFAAFLCIYIAFLSSAVLLSKTENANAKIS